MTSRIAVVLSSFLLCATLLEPAGAADWPRYRGPKGDGRSTEKFTGKSLKQLWSKQVGAGFSSVSVSKGKAYTMGNDGKNDTVWCFDASTGKVVWKDSYACSPGNYKGPRATPTVDGSVVYCVSRAGHVGAWNAATGKKIWFKDIAKASGNQAREWGVSGSPVVYGKLLILNIGTAGVGVDKASGKVVWKSKAGKSGFATPVIATVGGKPIAYLFGATALHGVNPSNGSKLFLYPWKTKYEVNAADPIPSGSNVLISSGYAHGSALVKIASGKPSTLWEKKILASQFSAGVLVGDYVYGIDNGTLKCVSYKGAAEKWKQRGVKAGVICADGKLIGVTSKGEVFTALASPSGYRELAKTKVLSGKTKCWTPPAFANGKIYCRDQGGQLVCVSAK